MDDFINNDYSRENNNPQDLSKGHKVGGSGAALAILCFFLPWILVSCGGEPVAKLSGWQLAAGTRIMNERIPGEGILFLILLSAILVLGVVFMAKQRGQLTKLDGFGLIGLGALPLLIILIKFSDMGGGLSGGGVGLDISLRLGFWGVIIGFIAVIIGGVINLQDT